MNSWTSPVPFSFLLELDLEGGLAPFSPINFDVAAMFFFHNPITFSVSSYRRLKPATTTSTMTKPEINLATTRYYIKLSKTSRSEYPIEPLCG